MSVFVSEFGSVFDWNVCVDFFWCLFCWYVGIFMVERGFCIFWCLGILWVSGFIVFVMGLGVFYNVLW